MDYPFLDVEKVKKVLGDRVLCEWEEAREDLLQGKLVMPKTLSEKHYTGIVLKKGIYVGSDDLEEGSRVFWEQFSGFEKFQSLDGKKRYAFVNESAIHAIIPKRVKLEASDWNQYGTGEE